MQETKMIGNPSTSELTRKEWVKLAAQQTLVWGGLRKGVVAGHVDTRSADASRLLPIGHILG